MDWWAELGTLYAATDAGLFGGLLPGGAAPGIYATPVVVWDVAHGNPPENIAQTAGNLAEGGLEAVLKALLKQPLVVALLVGGFLWRNA